jgi:hypothetical protein
LAPKAFTDEELSRYLDEVPVKPDDSEENPEKD